MQELKRDADSVLGEYLEIVDRLAAANGDDDLWWVSLAASKNRFESPLLFLLKGAIRGGEASWWKERTKELHTILAHVRRFLWRIKLSRRLFPIISADDRDAYLIKSFAYPSSFKQGKFFDPFFPGLADYINEDHGDLSRAVTVCLDFEADGSVVESMAGLPSVYPLERFIAVQDVLHGALRVALHVMGQRFEVPSNLVLLGTDVSSDVRTVLKNKGVGVLLNNYLHKTAARNMGRIFSPGRCAMTYEGNSWERMFVAGLREACPQTIVLGCQHSVVTRASAGVFPGEEELGRAPLPDAVLTTGDVPAKLIRRYSAWPAERVEVACALRYEYLHGLQRQPSRPPEKILVAIEGVTQAIDLVAYALDQAKHLPDCHFVLRGHPVLPVESFFERLGVDIGTYENVSVSRERTVVEDLTACDALLYWGTTVSLEALKTGMPVICLDMGDVPSYDPLEDCADNKWTVSPDSALGGVIQEIRAMSEDQRAASARAGADYIAKCFHPVTKEALAKFYPSVRAQGAL